ncbi:3-dehydroquinate synthase family protein [Micromonospora chokoriensis]
MSGGGNDATFRVDVQLGERAYPVIVGSGVRHRLAELVADLGARRAAVVTARPTRWTPDPGVPTLTVPAVEGERIKSLVQVERWCELFADFGLSRGDVVVSCGGGSVTDTVGLAAALFHRGVPVIHLPTSLLAQVDASVGGKTAVNLQQGKNLVGTYWQPYAVVCDTDYLETLPDRHWRNGYGEIARCHFIGAGDLRELPLVEQLAAAIRRKAEIVAADERDSGLRHILNYGHTLGHALERATGYAVAHGEGVAIGTVFAGRLAGSLGRIPASRVVEHHEVVAGYGLPTALPAGVRLDDLLTLMRRDKKAVEDFAFVLDGINGAELVSGIPERLVAAELAAMPSETRSHELAVRARLDSIDA